MKKQPSPSGFIKFRLLIAGTLCLGSVSLAATAFGAWPAIPALARHISEKKSALQTKIKLMERRSGGAAKSSVPATSSGAANTARPAWRRIPFTGFQPTVTKRSNAAGQTVYSVAASRTDVSPPLTELATRQIPSRPKVSMPEHPLPASRIVRTDKKDPVTQVAPRAGAPAGTNAPIAPKIATTGFNFEGITGSVPVVQSGASYPPDNNGSVGNDQFVEMVNSRYQIWSLDRATNTPTSILGPVNNNTLWAGFGGACEEQNAGDPIVLYDKLANRWFLSQFTSEADANGVFYQCVAVSTTPDATGTYTRYAFAVPDGDFGDYPHYGVWPDAYYVMAHHFTPTEDDSFAFNAASFGAMDRAKMLAGDPTATYQVILDENEGGHMPADLDGFAPPPAGAPGIFTSWHADGMYLYRMKVDWANQANTVRTEPTILPIAPAGAACGGTDCIPQPNSVVTLDSLGDRLMFRLAYRNFIDHESLVVSHAVNPGIQGVASGVRWYEFRLSGQPNEVCETYPCTYQQGTVADEPNGRSRWMSSIAQDGAGNILVGYSTTGTNEPTDAHSIRYTGRTASDPLGKMTSPETIIITGNRNEVADNTLGTLPGRWGDYTSTSIDPADDCTFWHVNQYYTQPGATNFEWHTRIASARFSGAQCQASTCTTRPTSAPTVVSTTAIAPNEIQVTWNAVTPAAGSYAIERKVGAPGGTGTYQPLGFVSGAATSYIDRTVEGGLTYTYRVIAATDAAGRCQAFVQSNQGSATATGSCTLKPVFAGATTATSANAPTCGVNVSWAPATSSCPLSSTVKYNVYRGTVPDFVPSAGNRIATCISGPSSYLDTDNLTPGNTYYYVVRAEDNSTGNGGACGGNEESNTVRVAGTAYGSGTQASPGTWIDGGGDGTSFLRLNTTGTGNTEDPTWRIVRTADDPGANHTPDGDYAYRVAGPGPEATHGSMQCAAAETPVLTVASTTVNLTYWERHQLEKGWDGVAIEYSRNGGEWTDVPAPSNSTADGCMTTDVTADYATLECTISDGEPLNACEYPAEKPVITGPSTLPVGDCTTYMTGGLTDYARRCHRLTGLNPGDTIQFRWRFTSDPATEFAGFYLDDIAITDITLPNTCVPGTATDPGNTPSPSLAAQALNISTRMFVGTGDEVMIGGFIITGDAPKRVAIRGMGPMLAQSGIGNFLADPVLDLRNSNDVSLAQNDNWRDGQASQIEGTALQPGDDREAVIIATLSPGAYTALLTGKDQTTGLGLVEVYDLDAAAGSRLGNISTRGFVRTGDEVMIGGFILGNNTGNARIAVRGRGSSLAQSGLDPVLQDPMLEIRDSNGALVVANDDWETDPASAAELTAAGLAPMEPKEAGVFTTLPPGAFTAILFGKDEGTGIGIVEIYNLR